MKSITKKSPSPLKDYFNRLHRVFTNSSREQNFNPRIREIPSFFSEIDHTKENLDIDIQDIPKFFGQKKRTHYEKVVLSVHGKASILKAHCLSIPFDWNNIGVKLVEQVDSFQELIARAKEFNVNWEHYGYDPVAIEQAIIASMHDEENDKGYALNEFYNNLGVGNC